MKHFEMFRKLLGRIGLAGVYDKLIGACYPFGITLLEHHESEFGRLWNNFVQANVPSQGKTSYMNLGFMCASFEASGRHVISPSINSVLCMSQTEIPLPISMVKPPFDCIYFNLPGELKIPVYPNDGIGSSVTGYVRGAYWKSLSPKEVRLLSPNTPRDFGWMFGVVSERLDATLPPWEHYDYMNTSLFHAGDRTGEEVIFGPTQLPPQDFRLMQSVFRLLFNAALFMSNPGACSISRNTGSKYGKFLLHPSSQSLLWQYVKCGWQDEHLIDMGASLPVSFLEDAETSLDSRSAPRTHWRRGHWHAYWEGASGDRSLVPHWIRPILVNSDAGPAPQGSTREVNA